MRTTGARSGRRVRSAILAFAACAAVSACIVAAASTVAAGDPPDGMAAAIFGGGCFWSMEHVFDGIAGVQSVAVGYTGGRAKSPSYQQVEMGITGHVEAVRVVYDPAKVPYETLLNAYWRNTDPSEGAGQFCDFGSQYRPIIFYADEAQHEKAEASKKTIEESHRFKRVLTQVVPASTFWIAEDYHQHFYKTHASAYEHYRIGCGRDARLQELWGR
ncbi:MAG TPA: peptide-methionine (S)-S-oxide reductase MsrA [Vicinamibacterales bacterium]|nr:peptide-methionine (S)-S-oxide reductase MsrA [Vicinamibacterales bacterium]